MVHLVLGQTTHNRTNTCQTTQPWNIVQKQQLINLSYRSVSTARAFQKVCQANLLVTITCCISLSELFTFGQPKPQLQPQLQLGLRKPLILPSFSVLFFVSPTIKYHFQATYEVKIRHASLFRTNQKKYQEQVKAYNYQFYIQTIQDNLEQNRICGLDSRHLCPPAEQPGFPNCSLVWGNTNHQTPGP